MRDKFNLHFMLQCGIRHYIILDGDYDAIKSLFPDTKAKT